MNKTQRISNILFYLLSGFIIIWISFFVGAGLDRVSWRILLGALFLNLILSFWARGKITKDIFKDKENLALFLYIIFITIRIFSVKEKNLALNSYWEYVLPAPILFYLFRNQFILLSNKNYFPVFICICASIVSIIAVLEFIYRKNVLYQHFFPNLFYADYLLRHRAMSTQIIPLALGTYLTASLPSSFYLLNKESKFLKILGIIFGITILLGLISSCTKMALGASIFSTVVYLFMNKKLLKIFLPLILIFIFSLNIFGYTALERISFRNFFNPRNYIYRIPLMVTSIKMARDYPFFGVGLGHYKLSFDSYGQPETPMPLKTPDNMYLMMLCETGLLGFLAFIFFVYFLLKRAHSYIKLHKENSMAISLFAVVIAILLCMLTYDALYWFSPFCIFWIYCGMLASVINVKEQC